MNKKIIVVDDDEIILETVARNLEKKGFECLTFLDGESALTAYQNAEGSISIVITDLNMPGMGGFELANTLLQEEQKPVIIVLSSEQDISTVIKLMRTGVFDYVVKPCNYDELAIKIEKGFELAELKKLQWVIQREKEIRMEQQLNWNIWKEHLIKRDNDKTDSNLIANINTSLTQGAGLGTISTIIGMIKSSAIEDGDYVKIKKKIIQALYTNGEFTNKLLNTLEEIEKVINSKLSKEKIPLSEIRNYFIQIMDEVKNYKISSSRPIKLGENVGLYDLRYILINRDYIIKAFKEMVYNALKFSNANSSIYILFEIQRDEFSISFLNSPMKDYYGNYGIPEEYHGIIFEPFFRLSRLVFEELPTLDFGLGLTFTEKILRAHGGKISIFNVKNYLDNNADKLLNMTLTLPISS